MPGLAGVLGRGVRDHKAVVRAMIDSMQHRDSYVADKVYKESALCGSRIHLGVLPAEIQPHCSDGLVVWAEGEIYAVRGGAEGPVTARLGAAETLARVVRSRGFAGLADVDGAYAGVVWDGRHEKLHLITDRYGARQLFWTRCGDALAWASESKAFLAVPAFRPRIDATAVSQFLDIGYLLGERTWMEGVELVPSGSVLSWDARNSTVEVQRYWWWDRIGRREAHLDPNSLADELADLFREAVRRRYAPGERAGVLLSGGLDSRALLAAASEIGPGLPTLTFGRPNSADLRIAERVASVAESPHRSWILTESSWVTPRLAGVWWSEGQFSLQHMHGIEAHSAMRELFSINLSGFSGDLILGGSYLHGRDVVDRFDRGYVARTMGCDQSLLGATGAYEDLGRVDYYFLDNRVRRFTQVGSVISLTIIHDRQPFLDIDLVEFAYSLPDDLRFESRLYNLMLLRAFPSYYRRIPWQKTGLAIGLPPVAQRVNDFSRRGRLRLARHFPRLAPLVRGWSREFADYDAWLRVEPARSLVETTLKRPDALLWDYVDHALVERDLLAFAQRRLGPEQILRYVTAEVWLRQLLTGEFRPRTAQRSDFAAAQDQFRFH